MKKIFLIVLFFILFSMVGSSYSFAKTPTQIPVEATDEVGEATGSAEEERINYELPYPGILPDHPLYPLKMIRDRIIELLTSDPVKKANFYLLQADKRLSAGILLFEKGKGDLSETTISKGQNYLEKALESAIKAKTQQDSALDIAAKISASSIKHKEEIEKINDRAKGNVADKFGHHLKRAEEFENRASQFKP